MQDDLFLDDDENDENIYDSEASESDLRNAVLYHTDWTVETLVNQIKKGRIELSPEFQRREAWTLKAKSLLVESIILNFPIPAITLAERDGKFIVVDGKQRLTTIAQYLGEMPGTKYNSFKLSGLAQLKHLNSQNYSDLNKSSSKDCSSLENYPIRTNIIRGWKNDSVLFNIFHRLNSGSVKLSPQELRQSLHPGEFTRFITEYCENSNALREIFPGIEPDFRMRDVELAIRYLSLALFIEKYSGDLKKQLDGTVGLLNENWSSYGGVVKDRLQVFEETYVFCREAFKAHGLFKKWTGQNWESRTNRAIFDAIMFCGLRDSCRSAYKSKPQELVDALVDACMDPKFRDAIEKTTKTTEALFDRISVFCRELSLRGFDAPIIELNQNRIEVKRL